MEYNKFKKEIVKILNKSGCKPELFKLEEKYRDFLKKFNNDPRWFMCDSRRSGPREFMEELIKVVHRKDFTKLVSNENRDQSYSSLCVQVVFAFIEFLEKNYQTVSR